MNRPPQRRWSDIEPGDALPPLAFPLSLYRLVMAAGANRDFNSIHHNTEHAQSTGAADAYANVLLLQGMWERSVRAYIGLAGVLRSLQGFRMKSFNTVGSTAVVQGKVLRKWRGDGGEHLVEIEIWTENDGAVTVGPGQVVVAWPE
ncbi:acyl dehydratase [Rhodoferax koreense]|uniref:Acyl dehydratase n=1 Tax=Rhodoferax koreensis TaxID=1842727 RepID=A0A1P8K2W4_9BURK|nr:acyl dehydratase [Rhodoferax koreense]APW40271.1 acyl dehydratase [Rhodoferax koreense]